MKKLILTLTTLLSFAACSSTPKSEPPSSVPLLSNLSTSTTNEPTAALENVEVELSYVLGHDHYKLQAWSKQGRLEGKSFMNRKILKSSSRINRKNFESWIARIQNWVSEKSAPTPASAHVANNAAADSQCRSPYWLTLKSESGIKTIEGCRTSGSDATSISRISREGDFLLYSSK